MNMKNTSAVAILTYKRNYLLKQQLEAIESWHDRLDQVIVVDNANEVSTADICAQYPWVDLIQARENLGAAGRNLAFEQCRTDILITLDDDVIEFRPEYIEKISQAFTDESLACINFKVTEENTGKLVNWVHHRSAAEYANERFETYEITEGAAAFRRSCLDKVGGYPKSFFLSHEGPDLAWRLMDQGWRVIYDPAIQVTHLFAPEGRANWRNYYFDTRNTLWLALRNLPLWYGIKLVVRQNCAMGFYSVRDGFTGTWLRAWRDALRGARQAMEERKCLAKSTMKRITNIDSFRPSLLRTIKSKVLTPANKLSAT